MYTGDIKVGDKFEIVAEIDGNPAGQTVEVTGFDCDNWPYIRNTRTGSTSCPETSRFRNCVMKANTEFDTQWCAWNHVGSMLASSEEEAKHKAEEILTASGGPVYIAKAEQKVERNAVVWTK